MARVKRGVQARRRHKAVIKACKGFQGRAKNCYTVASRRLDKSRQYAYRDRRTRKRDFRSLWIQRINAAARLNGIRYSILLSALKKMNFDINRKVLADIAVKNFDAFQHIVMQATNFIKSSVEDSTVSDK